MFVTGSSQASNAVSNYQISNSLRFQSASATYATRTFGTPTNQRKFTYSLWVKLGLLSINSNLLGACTGGTNDAYIQTYSNNLIFGSYTGAGQDYGIRTTAVYRDPSAWYHVVCVFDTANATSTDRAIIYINNVRQTVTTATNGIFPSNFTNLFNSAVTHGIGIRPTYGDYQLDGYVAEVNFVDGQALTPSSFGETNPYSGQWVAKKYTGTYGNNGFYLPFSNGTSTTTLGADSSGNGNNWTLNNFTRSAGSSDCWMFDVPSGNGGASSTQPSSNYCVMNPLAKGSIITLAKANLNVQSSSSGQSVNGTIGVSSGKWYWETVLTAGTDATIFGIQEITELSTYPGYTSTGYSYYPTAATKINGAVQTSYGVTATTNDVIGCALDMDSGKIWWSKNGVWMASGDPVAGTNPAFTSITGMKTPAIGDGSSGSNLNVDYNFGQRSFAYTPPTGFKALCTGNLPASTIPQGNKFMDATLYTGNGSTQTITNAGAFQPDLVWMKARSNAYNNLLHDSVRGVTQLLISNTTAVEEAVTNGITSFNSNGFSLGANGSYNQSSATYVGWQWQAGRGVKSTNTDGTIASVVSVSKAAGFSVVTFTKGGTATTKTIGHGLGIAPSMIIAKTRTAVDNWPVYHISNGATFYQELNTTIAKTSGNPWGNTTPTSSVFSIQDNGTANWVAYCFSEIAGFSKFGSYTGNGSADGPFCFTGFRPKFVMMKSSSVGGAGYSWCTYDTSRNPNNVSSKVLLANTAEAEQSLDLDILSNGFKLRNSGATQNGNGQTYIYLAFAENPFANANAR